MNPPGFKRVHRSLMYRKRPDGKPDVHRILANSEDVVKTRMLAALDKARVVQFYLWIDRYDESDVKTHTSGRCQDPSQSAQDVSGQIPPSPGAAKGGRTSMLVRGMALLDCTGSSSCRRSARAQAERYKDAYGTFPHDIAVRLPRWRPGARSCRRSRASSRPMVAAACEAARKVNPA